MVQRFQGSKKAYAFAGGLIVLGFGAVALMGGTFRAGEVGFKNILAGTALSSPVHDAQNYLPSEDAAQINQTHRRLIKDYDIDYHVVISSLESESIEEAARQAFEEYNVGEGSLRGSGLLLLIDPRHNQVRLEVSKGLDAVYTDAFVSYIQHRQMIPFFKTGQVARGIEATTEMIFTRAQDAVAGNQFVPPLDAQAIGAGVSNPAHIGEGDDRTFRQREDVVAADQSGPLQVLQSYQTALEARNGNPELSIYSSDTKDLLKKWTVTPAQMDNEAVSLRKCSTGDVRISGVYAVIRRPMQERQCPPYFFVFEDGAWKLEFSILQSAIRFNHNNEWHFDFSNWNPQKRDCVCHYMFAFDDWSLNRSGYPVSTKKFRWNMRVATYEGQKTIIEAVGPDSPAFRLGFRGGDRIIRWENIDNPDHREVFDRMDRLEDGEKFSVIIERGGQRLVVSGEAPKKLEQ